MPASAAAIINLFINSIILLRIKSFVLFYHLKKNFSIKGNWFIAEQLTQISVNIAFYLAFYIYKLYNKYIIMGKYGNYYKF